MERNFFEAIGLADVERVHSQVLAWLFESNFLSVAQKSDILAKLVGIAEDCSQLSVYTEHEYIDVLIKTASSLIAIENKIKSAEHDDQLLRCEEALRKKAKSIKLIYLSLCPEIATHRSWIYRTYADLHLALLQHVFISPACFEESAFNEYVKVVQRLVEVVRAFDADHTRFKNVFTDGSLTKYEKRNRPSGYLPDQDFVRRNQLETPLQRYFLTKIRDEILPASADCRVEESHGVALLHVLLAKHPVGGTVFQWAVQFQGTTAKLNCLAWYYDESISDQLPSEVKKDFKLIKSLRSDLRGPNIGRTKAYISLSKKMDFEWTDSFDRIAESHRLAYEDLSVIGQQLAVKYAS
jgi:hypothetical protein